MAYESYIYVTKLGDVARSLPRRSAALWRRLTTRSSSNFKFAFLFLGREQRLALQDVYAFCRVVDDIVDERAPGEQGELEARTQLQVWREEVDRIFSADDNPPQTELGARLRAQLPMFAYPRDAFDEIIEGVAMDLERSTYDRMSELRTYCYRVASCVGFLCIAIFGDQSVAARRYAEHLGLALQYTNILRDVAEDAGRGRVYLPRELLARHRLHVDDIAAQRYDQRFLAMAQDFAQLAEDHYAQAWAALRHANRRNLLPAEVMGRTYHRILRDIVARNFNVFTQRAALRRRDKLKVAIEAMARAQLPWAL